VYSEPGKGTTFSVYLPATLAEIQKRDRQEPQMFIGQGELVLVAEDEESIREVIVLTLEEYGYKVLAANDGEDAVALYSQNKDMIKVVLMDIMMPVMDGYDGIKAIRKINPEVKIIAVSGLVGKDELAQIADIRVNAFLQKPYTSEKVLKTIHDVLMRDIR
jgi:CheY-like chemotaxis protein